mmetsp:Transcript_112585/g.313181  ORF Transcript_112585/g.313181 Transcript_112585/m.313181 type:complete len:366 (-) Transcript_112585:88-1185(-)
MGKLKRFLLRYEPPGIGLEVEDEDGNVDVRHKNLPPSTEVSSVKEINSLVEGLIMEEEILTKRRHRPALMQLLGRLYQVEVDPTDDEAPESVPSPTASIQGLQEGQQVVLVGLKGKQQAFNGEVGTLTKVKKDKFEVLISSSRVTPEADTLKVKGAEHVVPVAPKGTPLAVGTHVAIRGLRNHVELNGCLGRVVECHEETHRFEVRATESGQLFRVKQENLIPIEPSGNLASTKENREPNTGLTPRTRKEASGGVGSSAAGAGADQASAASIAAAGDGIDEIFEPGSSVQLVGLKTAMCYNGQTADVLSVDRVRCRYEIRLNDGSVKTIRAENVRLVSGPSKTSPRTRRAKDGAAAGAGQSGKVR